MNDASLVATRLHRKDIDCTDGRGLVSCAVWLARRPARPSGSRLGAARRLGITPRTLYRFIDQGELPAYRFGRVIRLKDSDVETFIEAHRIEPGTLEHLYPDAAKGH